MRSKKEICFIEKKFKKYFFRKSEAMNRPKKDFIPTSLSDLNIDSISIGSNGDRHNNNSNGARLNNFDRFKATSSSNLSYKHSNLTNHNSNNFGGASSRSSKLYGSQSNLSARSSTASSQNIYQPVVYNRNYNVNPAKTSAGDTDKWLQAWEDTNNNNEYRAPSYNAPQHQQQRQHSKLSIARSNSNNFNSNTVVDPFDPFEDPWSGISSLSKYLLSLSLHICTYYFHNFSSFSLIFIFFSPHNA